jgi:hypothetical protein
MRDRHEARPENTDIDAHARDCARAGGTGKSKTRAIDEFAATHFPMFGPEDCAGSSALRIVFNAPRAEWAINSAADYVGVV